MLFGHVSRDLIVSSIILIRVYLPNLPIALNVISSYTNRPIVRCGREKHCALPALTCRLVQATEYDSLDAHIIPAFKLSLIYANLPYFIPFGAAAGMNSFFLRTSTSRLLLRQRPVLQCNPFKMSYIAAGATPGGAKATLKDGNRLKALFDANKPAFGGWQMIPGAAPARILAQSGVDWVLVDCEHGSLDGMLHWDQL